MKRVIRTIAAVAILFATTTGMANEPKLVTDGISKNLVFEWETQLSEATLKIVDTNGNTVYLDALDDVERYVKKFNLSHLKAGTYFLSLEDGTREFVYSIAVNKNNISILGMDESLKPAFREKEGSVYLNFLNRDMGNVKLALTNPFGNVLFEEIVEDSFVVGKAFNFKDAIAGEYTISLNDGEKTFYKTFRIKK